MNNNNSIFNKLKSSKIFKNFKSFLTEIIHEQINSVIKGEPHQKNVKNQTKT